MFVDTSALYAAAATRDQWHAVATRTLRALRRERASLVTSEFVLLETYVLTHARTGRVGLLRMRQALQASSWLHAVAVPPAWQDDAWAMLERHADKEWSYVDATSFVAMQRLGVDTALAFDAHFRQAGFTLAHARP